MSKIEEATAFVSFLGPTGLNWKKLKETLNPNFDWDAAVQAALNSDDSLEDVCYLLFFIFFIIIIFKTWLGFSL